MVPAQENGDDANTTSSLGTFIASPEERSSTGALLETQESAEGEMFKVKDKVTGVL